ncbi:MAG: acyltransferase domain-containing protein, partial [Planctomycetaceae bacterium]|nr:acyltransferase domain-containing protein [Planctomycetaceae bacterium]
DDCSQVLPGEGVVTLLLCRLSDAQRVGLTVYGTIHDVSASRENPQTATSAFDSGDARIIRQIGYVSGAQSLIRLVAETVHWQRNQAGNCPSPAVRWGTGDELTLVGRACDGFLVRVAAGAPTSTAPKKTATSDSVWHDVSHPVAVNHREDAGHDKPAARGETKIPENPTLRRLQQPPSLSTHVPPPVPNPVFKTLDRHTSILRIGAATEAEFLQAMDHLLQHSAEAMGESAGFRAENRFRLAMRIPHDGWSRESLESVRKEWAAGTRRRFFEREQAVVWERSDLPPRVAWLFPGQGSQYAGRPSVLDSDEAAAAQIQTIDRVLSAAGLATFSRDVCDSAESLGLDVWKTQLWVLSIGIAFHEALKSRAYRPDIVLGHSFGEYVAAVAAGVMSVEQAVRMTRSRSDAVLLNSREAGLLLSVRGELSSVAALVRKSGLNVTVTHCNSPEQTVVAGPTEAVQAFRKTLSEARLASVVVPVPAPFHTPMMAEAERAMRRAVSNERLRPPACGFLSATSAQFLAEPDDIRDSLVTQLTHPVLYQPAVKRLLDADCGVLLEVGPNDVLTRLNRDIIRGGAVCLSLDVPGKPFTERMELVDMVMDCVADNPPAAVSVISADAKNAGSSKISARAQSGVSISGSSEFAFAESADEEIEIIDVTRTGRRSASAAGTRPAA